MRTDVLIKVLKEELLELTAEKKKIDARYNSIITTLKNYDVNVDKLNIGVSDNLNNRIDLSGFEPVLNTKADYIDKFKVTLPLVYNPNYGNAEKAWFALKEIGSGTVEDIVDWVLSKERNMGYTPNKKKITDGIRQNASKLFRAGYIDANKIGKKYQYVYKEESNE